MTREEVIKIVNEARAAGTRPNLAYANLAYANLRAAILADANLRAVFLAYANLTYANLRGANLRGVNLTDANLRGANLRGVNLEGAYLNGADLTGVQIDYDIPKVANLIGKILDADRLDMSDWHSECGTAHCLAGWATTLAGEAGAKLEKEIGTAAAGALIWHASTGEIPDFYNSDKYAKQWLRERSSR